MKQYMLISLCERDLANVRVSFSLREARKHMKDELISKFGGSLDDRDDGSDYGICDFSAWANIGDNWDWKIIELSVCKNRIIQVGYSMD